MYRAPHICFDRILPEHVNLPLASAIRGPFGAIVFPEKLWPNKSTLRVRFLEGTQTLRERAMAQAKWWTEHANLNFVVSNDVNAELRVTFNPNDGAWSYVGTDALSIPTHQATMNLGFEDGGTAGHEFGHAIGMLHEHQNPQGGIEWNEEEVIRDLSGPPNNWTPEQVRHNVLNKYSQDQIKGTEFDPDAIMLYAFPGRWTRSGVGTRANHRLSAVEKAFIARMYPRDGMAPVRLDVTERHSVDAAIGQPGEEDLFVFTVGDRGRYVVETGGETDVVMALYGPNSQTQLVAQDDDSGNGRNARIVAELDAGDYVVQVRHFNRTQGTGDYSISVTH